MTEIIWDDGDSTFDLGPAVPPPTQREIDDVAWSPRQETLPKTGLVTEEEIIRALIDSFRPPPLEFPDQLL